MVFITTGKTNYKDFDIHVLCGALKTFFRELEEPLIPFSLHQEFLNSISNYFNRLNAELGILKFNLSFFEKT
jgi:hypothetical protein